MLHSKVFQNQRFKNLIRKTQIEKIQEDINLNDTKIAETLRHISDYQQMVDELHKPFKALNLAEERKTAPNVSGRPSIFNSEYHIIKDEKVLVERLHKYTSKFSI